MSLDGDCSNGQNNTNGRGEHAIFERLPIPPPQVYNGARLETSYVRQFLVDPRNPANIKTKDSLAPILLSSSGNSYQFDTILRMEAALGGSVHVGFMCETLSPPIDNGRIVITHQWTTPDIRKVAIKTASLKKWMDSSIHKSENPATEISLNQILGNNPFLPNFIESCVHSQKNGNGTVYMIFEFIEGGDLMDYIDRMPSEDVSRNIFTQIVRGVQFLHMNSICHRDLSLENIMFNPKTMTVKIIDLGMAIQAQKKENSLIHEFEYLKAQPSCGKLSYMAPEIISMMDHRPDKADVWTLGVILFALITCGASVLDVKGACYLDDRFRRLQKSQLNEMINESMSDINRKASIEIKDLLNKMLKINIDERCTLNQIINHPWLLGQSTYE